VNVRETQYRLWSERLKRLLEHDDEAVARLAAVAWVLLVQQGEATSFRASALKVKPSTTTLRMAVSSGGSDTRLDLGPSRGLNIELTAGRPGAARCAGQLTSPRPRSSRVSLPPFELKEYKTSALTGTGEQPGA
jgi:hypothetical protein